MVLDLARPRRGALGCWLEDGAVLGDSLKDDAALDGWLEDDALREASLEVNDGKGLTG